MKKIYFAPATEVEEMIESEAILQASFESQLDNEGGNGNESLFHLDEESIVFGNALPF